MPGRIHFLADLQSYLTSSFDPLLSGGFLVLGFGGFGDVPFWRVTVGGGGGGGNDPVGK